MDSPCVGAILMLLLMSFSMGQVVANPCEPDPCAGFGGCVATNDRLGYTCECITNYIFIDGTCKLDPCFRVSCDLGECEAQPDGGYICICPEGMVFQDGTCVTAPCPECYNGQCAEGADAGAVAQGAMRTARQLNAELPEGCGIELGDFGEETAKIECRELEGKVLKANYSADHRRWVWGDGNCCCPAFRYMWCPTYLRYGTRTVRVLQSSNARQCWSQAICGLENGICKYKCLSHPTRQPVFVEDGGRYRWIYYTFKTGCRCTDCYGNYCRAAWYLGDGRSGYW